MRFERLDNRPVQLPESDRRYDKLTSSSEMMVLRSSRLAYLLYAIGSHFQLHAIVIFRAVGVKFINLRDPRFA